MCVCVCVSQKSLCVAFLIPFNLIQEQLLYKSDVTCLDGLTLNASQSTPELICVTLVETLTLLQTQNTPDQLIISLI